MSIEAMKQAVEALEMYLKMDTMDEAHILEVDIAPKTITALRAAIEQAEKQEPVAQIIALGQYEFPGLEWLSADHSFRAPIGTLLYTTPPAAPRQDQYDQTSLELCDECGWKAMIPGDGCLVCARQKSKPVAYVDQRIHGWPDCFVMEPDPPHTTPLYTAPRQWVGLTTQEIEYEWERVTGHSIFGGDRSAGRSMFLSPDEVVHYTQAIEAKLKAINT